MTTLRVMYRFVEIFYFVTLFMTRLALTLLVEKARAAITGKPVPSSGPRQLRTLLERLQFTFIKLGQILAMRPDLVPQSYAAELIKLLDDVPPFSDEHAVRIIEEQLGGPIDLLFESFDRDHISAASFGQVYRAWLPSGEKVVVKVLRPGIRPIVHAELALVRFLGRLMDLTTILGTFRLAPFLSDFATYTKEELSYVHEARQVRRMYERSLDDAAERIPQVYSDFCTDEVLTLEYLEGEWMSAILLAIDSNDQSKLAEYKDRGIDLTVVAERLLLSSMIQPFEKSYFHADPHAANVCVMEDNVIGYVDFGIVGRLDAELKDKLLVFLEALYREDVATAYDMLMDLVLPPANVDLSDFEKELKELLINWLEVASDPTASLAERSTLRRMIQEGIIMRKYGLSLPEITSRFYRSMMITEMTILQLDPTLDIIAIREKYFRDLVFRTWKERISEQNLLEVTVQSLYLLLTLPKRVNQLLDGTERMLRQSGTAISNLRIVPSAVSGLLGKLAIILSLAGLGLRFIFGVEASYQLLSRSYTLAEMSGVIFVVGLLLVWLSRYLVIR